MRGQLWKPIDTRTVRRALHHDLEHEDILMQIPLAKVLPCALILRKYDHLQTQLQHFEDAGVEESAITPANLS